MTPITAIRNNELQAARTLLDILHAGSTYRFIQNIDNKRTIWFHRDAPIRLPSTWETQANVFYGVHGAAVKVTDGDRAKPKNVGKKDTDIEPWVTSKIATIETVNALYAEFDGKDFTAPSQAEIDAQFAILRANPDKAKSTDKALRNEALGNAKSAKYLTDPEHYKALATAHVAQLSPAPSVIVASGGGWQCYWLLAETFYLRTDADRAMARDIQERWVMFVGGDPGAKDLARKLRLPGSHNFKKKYAPNYPLVSFTKADFSLRYTLDALQACLPAVVATEVTQKPQQSRRQPQALQEAAAPPAFDLATLQAKGDSLISLFNTQFKIRDLLLHYGYSDQGDRMSRPGEPESKGVEIDPATNRSRHWSGNDPLYDPHWQTPFSVFCRMEHDGNFGAARQALIAAIIPPLRLWARTTSFEDYIPDELKTHRIDKETGEENIIYVADSTDTKVFDAMQDIYEKTGTFGATVSKRIGARNAGVGINTFIRSLLRMHNFFEVTQSITDHTFYVRLKWENVVLSKWITYSYLKNRLLLGDPFSANDKNTPELNEYSPRKGDEAFLTGTSKLMRERIQDIAQALDIDTKQAKEEYTHAGLGESGLRVIDAMLRAGEMNAAELAQETGKKVSAIRTAVRKLVQHGIVEAEREGSRGPKVYSLAPDVWKRVEEAAPNLRTYGAAAQRENKRLKDAQLWCDRGIEQAKATQETEKAQRLEQRKAKLAVQRIPHLARLLEGKATQEEIKEIAYNPGVPFGPHPAVQAKLERMHAQARMDLSEQRHKEKWENTRLLRENIATLKATNTPKREWYNMLTLAGFTPSEAKQAIALGGAA